MCSVAKGERRPRTHTESRKGGENRENNKKQKKMKMKILTRCTNVVWQKFGFYKALINFEGSRKVFEVFLMEGTNDIIKVEKEYKSKKEAFALNNVIY